MDAVTINPISKWAAVMKESTDIMVILGITSIVLLMVIPLPAFLLDMFLVFSIAISLLILLISFYSYKPLDFSVFPSLLLFSTLMRLTLNIASTRLILLHGSNGADSAGKVIHAFGEFVVGGNYVVGFVVFIILVIINFVVITKGSGRIAEVAARFTLDSMPGKQLAIDADLNAGIITDKDAKIRREKLEREADFYGAMDGASKFVRGDAIAGIIITIVNIVGGFIIGIAQQHMNLMDAMKVYTILSVGDGLVSQIPALIVSVSAGLIVTKVSKTQKLSEELASQAFQWKPLAMAGGILMTIAVLPGLPFIPFATLASIFGGMAYVRYQRDDKEQKVLAKQAKDSGSTDSQQAAAPTDRIDTIPQLDVLEVEVGYDLIPVVDQRSGGEFPTRILGIRRQFANEMGVLIPPVHIRDNLKLRPNEYKIYLKGSVVGQGELVMQHSLALDPGFTTRKIDGIPTKDPTFGLDAIWIPDDQKENAIISGYTVVDLPSVMATHLIEIVRHNLDEIFGRQDLANVLDQVKTTHPRIVTDLLPELLSFGLVLKVLQNLLRERVSIRDMVTILEALAEHATHTKDADELTEYARIALGRMLAQQHKAPDQNLYAITLSRNFEERIIRSISAKPGGSTLALDPNFARSLVENIGNEAKTHMANNQPPVVLTSQQVRPYLYKLIEKFIPNLAVLSHSEVAGHVSVRPVGMIGGELS